MKAHCNICNTEFRARPYRVKQGYGKYCSQKCYGISKRGYKHTKKWKDNMRTITTESWKNPEIRARRLRIPKHGHFNPCWKGGRIEHRKRNGVYILLKLRHHPLANSNGYYPEHRYVVEQHIGRHLLRTEQIHHKNGNTRDNRLENLMLCINAKEHKKQHAKNY